MGIGWRDYVLNHFVPDVARLTLVADPDRLLAESVVQRVIQENGFSMLDI